MSAVAAADVAPAHRSEPNARAVAASPKISIRNLSVAFSSTVVLDDVSLDVRPRELVSVVGPSGCGKTTLLNVIAGLIHPNSGELRLDGRLTTRPGAERAMVFQDDAVFPWMRVRRNAEYGLRLKGVPPQERKQVTDDVLRLVGLEGKDRLFPRQLSGGMRKRVDLARALAVKPEVLLMDEPYASLDALTKERLQVEFLRIWEQADMTAVFVTHDLEEAVFLGDRVVVMATNPGRIRSIHEIPFEHPRRPELKLTPAFQEIRGHLIEEM